MKQSVSELDNAVWMKYSYSVKEDSAEMELLLDV